MNFVHTGNTFHKLSYVFVTLSDVLVMIAINIRDHLPNTFQQILFEIGARRQHFLQINCPIIIIYHNAQRCGNYYHQHQYQGPACQTSYVHFTYLLYLLTSTCLEITINIRGIIAKQMDWNKFLPRKIFFAHYFWACGPE